MLLLLCMLMTQGVFASCGNLHDTAVRVNSGLSAIYRWMTDNKLTLNVDKSCYMVFRRRRRKINYRNTISIKIYNRDLTKVNHVRFLGVTLDESITWNYHISYVTARISRFIPRNLNASSILETFISRHHLSEFDLLL